MKDVYKQIDKYKWKQMWAGDWNMLNASDWGQYYMTDLKFQDELFLHRILFLFNKGKISAWADAEDIDNFSQRLLKYFDNIKKIEALAQDLRNKVRAAIDFIEQNKDSDIDLGAYNTYVDLIHQKYIPHVVVKYIVDALPLDLLEKYLPILEEVRVEAEPVFTKTIEFDKQLVKQIAKKEKIKEANILLYMTQSELYKYFEVGELPNFKTLIERKDKSILVFFEADRPYLLLGDEVIEAEKSLNKFDSQNELKGNTAYPGKVKGRVIIILDPGKPGDFSEGDILVTSMTRPEYLQLIKKSAAIVTEAGGILSHAAITARELKKPCVIGTMVATKVLKDGDMVEVDADNGIINIIK